MPDFVSYLWEIDYFGTIEYAVLKCASTGWFITNGTVQNTYLSADADVLDKNF